jgi:hypothetical protein
MCWLWRSNRRTNGKLHALQSAGAVLAILFCMNTPARAIVTATGDPGYDGVDDNLAIREVFTADPFAVTPQANRGVIADRRLRQTFKVPETLDVGEIVLSFDVGAAPAVGLGLRIYEIDDVNAGSWNAGNEVTAIVFNDTLPGSTQNLSFKLTGGNVFTLPARFDGTTGYGIEISTPFAEPGDGNPGSLIYNNDSIDHYADGRFYTETGGSSSTRDIGFALFASTEVACAPGDVDCMNGVDLDDLAIIAAHFRQNGTYDQGDLTGDGFIDFDDFDEWKQHYPNAFSASAAAAFFSSLNGNVPEPNSVLLAGFAALPYLSLARQRRKARSSIVNKSVL